MILTTLALATLTAITPTITYTTDSVGTHESFLTFSVQVNEDESKTLVFDEIHKLGYKIYDLAETPYIDGLKFDNEWVTDWKVDDYDDTIEHSILVKTVYTDDVAGMLARAKDGDLTALLSNPLTILQIFYYILAAISIAVGGFGLLKSKKAKIKSADEIAALVNTHAQDAVTQIKQEALATVMNIVTPTFQKISLQNQSIIEALVLARSGKEEDTLALVDLLKRSATEDISDLANAVKKSIQEQAKTSELLKKEAIETLEEIANSVPKDDGTSI